MKHFILQLLLALDQLANVLIGGMADETISARAWRADHKGLWTGRVFRPLIDRLFLWLTNGRDIDHCEGAYHSEILRRQLPPEYRNE